MKKPKGLISQIQKRIRRSKRRRKKYYNFESRQKKILRKKRVENIRANTNIKSYLLAALSKLPVLASWVICIGIALFVAHMLVNTYGQRVSTIGDSMKPELSNGDVALINRHDKSFDRGDIIAFKTSDKNSHYYVKRIIGLPGDTIEILENTIFLNGEKLEEKYDTTEINDAGLASSKIKLKKNEYFVLGDDRQNSEDSRDSNIGNVKKENIYGKVWFVVSPRSHFGFVK